MKPAGMIDCACSVAFIIARRATAVLRSRFANGCPPYWGLGYAFADSNVWTRCDGTGVLRVLAAVPTIDSPERAAYPKGSDPGEQ